MDHVGHAREPKRKKSRVRTIDRYREALLAMSKYCQEEWVTNMIRLHMYRGERLRLALLSGDAGCGKSYAIALLEQTLRRMGISVLVSAMTNKAAGTLMDSHSLESVYTFHKMMGLKKELLDETLPLEEFTRVYSKLYWGIISAFRKLYVSELPSVAETNVRHSCKHPRPESCAMCSKMFQRLRVIGKRSCPPPMESAPLFLGVNVLIVDEYGLMNTELLERMLVCLSLFYGPDNGPLIIFSGSVSQLQPVGSSPRIWGNDRFESLLSCSTPLFVNRRQFEDPGYGEVLTYLQFNTVTEESRRIFRSMVSVSESEVMTPEYEPEMLRIFHQDAQQITYTEKCMLQVKKTRRIGEKFLRVTREGPSHGACPTAWYEVLKQAAQALPKLFALPKYRAGYRPKERDYLKVDKLWIGCKVKLVWHMDVNGIHVASSVPGCHRVFPTCFSKSQLVQRSSIADTEGVIQDIVFKRDTQCNEFYVKGSQSGTLYRVAPSTWMCMNWSVTTHPIACLVAMNTYECQGCTVRGTVLYHPPRHFFMSPIKPSVYVALTRVVKRCNLRMTNCNFAETVGTVAFYDPTLLAYRIRVEMCYA